ncbi:anthrax toxin receptor-like [Mustela putorius furo]|uniref:Anthrax toxin receptor-like n=3 Tax=Mustela putorius furo TaxID=9669 RepID=A0A8U0USK5_MUSPF|nr:anthrax toxin receptor-like [Mustela putorius furo]
MGSHSLGLPGPALFLLLILPPPLLRAGSFLHTIKASRDMNEPGQSRKSQHHNPRPHGKVLQPNSGPSRYLPEIRIDESKKCQSNFDLYFILDKSGSVNNNWMDIYDMVEDLVNKFDNPNVRMSFITYSTEGHTLMKLTSDRNEIRDSLAQLQNVVPSGATNMQEGFKMANEQIEQENTKGKKIPIVILSLTDGTLLPQPFEDTKFEAEESRRLGATVYTIGVKDYRKDQLLEIADSPDHMFPVDNGFKELRNIVGKLAAKSCIDITKVEPSSFCAGENYELMITGTGFNNAKKKDEVICKFIFSENKSFSKKATTVEENTVICPGVKIDNPDQVVFVEVSLNNGINFISSGANITSKNCVSPRNAPEQIPLPVPNVPLLPVQPATPSPSKTYLPDMNPVVLAGIVIGLVLFPFLIWCIWRYCFKKKKEIPAVHIIEREPARKCMESCPTMVIPCGCQGGGIRRIEGKLDTLCDFVQSCNQVPLIWCQPKRKGRCFNFTLVKPLCRQLPCSGKVCLPSSQACFPINSCYSRCQRPIPTCSRLPSRMLPLISTPTRAVCGTTLSLPPP